MRTDSLQLHANFGSVLVGVASDCVGRAVHRSSAVRLHRLSLRLSPIDPMLAGDQRAGEFMINMIRFEKKIAGVLQNTNQTTRRAANCQ